MTTNNAVNVGLAGATGTGSFVGSNSPSLVTPVLGTPSSGNLSSCTNIPVNQATGTLPASSFPSGTLFNFQQNSQTGQVTLSPNNSWVDVTNVSVNITPTSSSNKVLVRAMISGAIGDASNVAMFRLVRGSTAIGIGVAGGSQTPCTTFSYNATNVSAVNGQPISMEFLDSPATTSLTIYKVQYFSAGTTTFEVNYWGNNASNIAYPNGISTISVCEVSS